jgi:hypothetical protein
MFDVVAKPNDWTKTVKSRVSNEKATPTELLRFDYWTALKEYLSNVPTFLKPQKPSTQHWTYFALGKSNFVLSVVISVTKKFIRVEFDIQDDRDKSIINELRLKYEAESKSSIDESIVWDGIEGKKMSWAYLVKDFDVTNRNKWTEQFEWIRDNVEKFDRFFRPIVKKR